ncbi:hypothetical protein GCM10009827_048180 [Dactylosporangium maewongense]|uniref:Uncharacterized protein n=1 Tax=Dactylosporangium maewongense TaxID=634393 RepID=A0ABP4LN67_9ACTN
MSVVPSLLCRGGGGGEVRRDRSGRDTVGWQGRQLRGGGAILVVRLVGADGGGGTGWDGTIVGLRQSLALGRGVGAGAGAER